jgi:hypothetical protein
MSQDYPTDDLDPHVVYAVEPVRSRRWLWWLLGIFGGGVVLVCGGCGALLFWASSHKSMEIYNATAERQGPSIVVRMNYTFKTAGHTVPFTEVVIEGPGWKHRQGAFGVGMIPNTGMIAVAVPPVAGQPRPGGSAKVYLESAASRGGGMERSSNTESVTIPP